MKKTGYWLFRHPAVMFTIGPLWSLVIGPRIPPKNASKKLRRSVHLTNLALLVIIGGICALIGPIDYLLIQAPTVFMAGSAGVWLFYVQHQFEDVYWENADAWSYEASALEGSSYLKPAAAAPVLHRQHRPSPRPPPERAHPELQPAARARRRRVVPLRSRPDVLGRHQGRRASSSGTRSAGASSPSPRPAGTRARAPSEIPSATLS